MHFEKWRAVPYMSPIISKKQKKKGENGLKGQKTSFLTLFGPFLDHFFGEKAPTPPLCQHSRPRGPVTCSRTRTHKCRYGTLVRPSTLWCVNFFGGSGSALGLLALLVPFGAPPEQCYMADFCSLGWVGPSPPNTVGSRAPWARTKKS